MDVLALPKKLGSLQYRAIVLPARLGRPTFLADESTVRLAYERVLGSLDQTAGSVFGDAALVQRGAALSRRTEVIEKAVALEAQAAEHAAAAETTRDQGLDDVRRERSAAAQRAASAVNTARTDEQAEKVRIAQETDQRERAEKARIEAEADRKASEASAALQADQARIDAAEKAVTAAPKAEVQNAVAQKRAANEQKRTAASLADLAEAERDSRR